MVRTIARFLQIFDLTQYCCAIERQVLIGYRYEFHDSADWSNTKGVSHEGLEKGGIAFVCCQAEVDRKSAECEEVCRIESTAEEHASAVGESDADRCYRSLIAQRKVVREVLEKFVFIFYLVNVGQQTSI